MEGVDLEAEVWMTSMVEVGRGVMTGEVTEEGQIGEETERGLEKEEKGGHPFLIDCLVNCLICYDNNIYFSYPHRRRERSRSRDRGERDSRGGRDRERDERGGREREIRDTEGRRPDGEVVPSI